MPVLSKTVLTNLGINLSDEAFASLSEHFEETLDTRVFDEIAYELSPEQAHELASMRSCNGCKQTYRTLQILSPTKSTSCSARLLRTVKISLVTITKT